MTPLSDDAFQKEVLESTGPVLIDFWAPWCGPCKNFTPILEEALKGFPDLKAFALNIDDNPETPTTYGVMSIPTLILFHNKQVVDTHVGSLQDVDSVKAWLKSTLEKAGA